MEFDFEAMFNPQEYLYFYEGMLTPARLEEEVGFLRKYAEMDKPLEVLDVPCGYGRHSNALAQLGHHVTGVDISDAFLQLAKEDAAKLGVEVKYIQKDMRELNYQHSFDRVISMFTSLGYFDDDQNEKVFRSIYQALKPGGIFCFDSLNRDTYIKHHLPTHIREREGNFLIDRPILDSLTGRVNCKRTLVYNNTVKNILWSVRLYNPTDILKLFKEIGFSSVEFFENWEGKQLGQESKSLIVLAKK